MVFPRWDTGMTVGAGYRLERFVGQGGFGEVWEAVDTVHDDRRVAVKALVSQEYATADDQARDVERFLLEAKETNALNPGPHIVAIFDWGRHEGRPYFVMPFVDGPNLGRLIADRVLTPQRTVDILGQVAEALEHAHGCMRVHRDVKPSNILVTTTNSRDYVTLVDFGIIGLIDEQTGARRTQTGVALGSLHYMAPERLRLGPSARPKPSMDVYGLACVLHECLTGERAFTGSGEIELAIAHAAPGRPRPSDHDPELGPFDQVVVEGLTVLPPDPDDEDDYGRRTATAAAFHRQMKSALRQWQDRAPVPPPPVVVPPGPHAPDVRDVPTIPPTPQPVKPEPERPDPDTGDPTLVERITTSPPALGAITGMAGALVGLGTGLDVLGTAIVIVGSYGGGASFALWRRRGS